MDDQRRQAQAWALFHAFANNLPPEISEERVAEYHGILQELGNASGEDLTAFRIPESELKPKVASWSRPTRRRRGIVTYTTERYCDPTVMRRQIEAVLRYFHAIQPPPPGVGFRP